MKMPVLFVGHGSPMNAVEDNAWSRGFRSLAGLLPEPKAILSVSAHWYVAGSFLTSDAQPRTIHDFGGFPEELYRMQYPAPGSPELAQRVAEMLGAKVSAEWGLDHGTWTVLHHLRPKADLPVVQLSIDARLPPEAHLELGRALQPLRDEGVLILASGNVTHNLRHAFGAFHRGETATPQWASDFDQAVASALREHDGVGLTKLAGTREGRLSHPSPDHFHPLLYAAGAASARDEVRFPVEGFDMGSLSMRSVLLG
jgi:4,5-DOPA dioxygenase extradiol